MMRSLIVTLANQDCCEWDLQLLRAVTDADTIVVMAFLVCESSVISK